MASPCIHSTQYTLLSFIMDLVWVAVYTHYCTVLYCTYTLHSRHIKLCLYTELFLYWRDCIHEPYLNLIHSPNLNRIYLLAIFKLDASTIYKFYTWSKFKLYTLAMFKHDTWSIYKLDTLTILMLSSRETRGSRTSSAARTNGDPGPLAGLTALSA